MVDGDHLVGLAREPRLHDGRAAGGDGIAGNEFLAMLPSSTATQVPRPVSRTARARPKPGRPPGPPRIAYREMLDGWYAELRVLTDAQGQVESIVVGGEQQTLRYRPRTPASEPR
jgi:hypothetical protein